MPVEIERKFLLPGPPPVEMGEGQLLQQGYLSDDPERTVRVRLAGEQGFLTIKGMTQADGLTRFEWEKEIPADDAQELLALGLPGVIVKTRYRVPLEGNLWEIDCYQGKLKGLWVAEVELASAAEVVSLPPWLGREVSGDGQYTNAALRRIVATNEDWRKALPR
ncbi:MAG: CYTH domain-containing protein [Opitutales bacterium]|nr:CYTH domain-containing protein [Opitutales bacterium]MCH8541381.1 CYTH domain-containing protein [Opitutales bacterium]